MPEFIKHEGEHSFLESDMRRLAAEVEKHRERPENRPLSDEELIRKSLETIQSAPRNAQAADDSSSPLPSYAQEVSAETKLEIEYLLDLAFHAGIEKANETAKSSSPFVLDAFHDALVGRLYPELQKRGIVK